MIIGIELNERGWNLMKMKLNEKDSIEQIIAILNIVSFDLP